MRTDQLQQLLRIAFFVLGLGSAATFAQETYSVTAVGPGAQVDLSGEIRWSKSLGTIPITAGLSAPDPDPCRAFHILVSADPNQTLIAYDDDLEWKPKAGDFNICKFSVKVASNIPISVYAALGRRTGSTEQHDLLALRKGWSGGTKIPSSIDYGGWSRDKNYYPGNLIDPQPKTGYKRGFERSNEKSLTLSRATFISFEMVYVDNRFQRYPKYQEPSAPPPQTPYLTASQVIYPNPLQPIGFVIVTWDAGADNPNAEISYKLNNSPLIPLVKQAKGGRQIPVERGRLYEFFLMDSGKTLATSRFVAN